MSEAAPAPPVRRPRWWRVLLAVGLTLAAVEYGVLPALVQARHDVELLASASVWLLALSLSLEVASVVCYTGLTRAVLPRRELLSWPGLLAIDVSGLGASHVVPGGGATAAALRFRLMVSAGITRRAALAAAAMQATVADLALAACYVLGVLAALPGVTHHPVLVAVAVGGGLVLALAGATGWRLGRVEEAPAPSAARRPVRSRVGTWLAVRWRQLAGDVRTFVRDESRTWPAIGFAMANWLLDAACLWVCLSAYGHSPGPAAVLVAYGFANLLALVPLTPGGIGVVEGTLIPLLLAFGASSPTAVLGVITWRLWQFWLPIPVALVAYLSLRARPGSLSRR